MIRTRHSDSLIPASSDWRDVAYHQPIAAAVDAWITAGCPLVINERGRADHAEDHPIFKHPLASLMLYLYSQNEYLNVRPYLISAASPKDAMLDWLIANVDLLFLKTPPLKTSIRAYRGLSDAVNLTTEGYVLNESYASFTIDQSVAEFFRFGQTGQTEVERGQPEPGTLLILDLPVGSRVLPLYYIQADDMNPEEEILLSRQTKIKPHRREGHILYCVIVS